MKSKLEAKNKDYDFLNLEGIQLYVISGVSEEKISFSI